jgi:hypothetical protein
VATRYKLAQAATVDLDDGRVVAKFTAGEHTPKDDAEAEALEHLVSVGAATRVKAKEG